MNLYQVFQDFRASLKAPPTQVTAAEVEHLLSTPLRQLSADDLDILVRKLLTSWGDCDDLRYFLPRMLEVVEDDREILYSKLERAGWSRWPEAQRLAVQEYLTHRWSDCLDSPIPGRAAGELACLAQTDLDLQPFLAAWLEPRSPGAATLNALAQLTWFAEREAPGFSRGRLSNAFFANRPEQQALILSWLVDPRTRDRLYQRWQDLQYSQVAPGLDADALEQAFQALDRLQASSTKS